MGSDMAMERISVSTYGRWEMLDDVQVFAIYQRSSYDNKEKQIWVGTEEDVENSRSLLLIIVPNIPVKPEPKYSLHKRLVAYLDAQEFCDGRGNPFDIEVIREIASDIEEIVEEDSNG